MRLAKIVNNRIDQILEVPDDYTASEDFIILEVGNVGDRYEAGVVIAPEVVEMVLENRPSAERRKLAYPSVQAQLDMLWHGMDRAPEKRVEPFYSTILAIKEANLRELSLNTPEIEL